MFDRVLPRFNTLNKYSILYVMFNTTFNTKSRGKSITPQIFVETRARKSNYYILFVKILIRFSNRF